MHSTSVAQKAATGYGRDPVREAALEYIVKRGWSPIPCQGKRPIGRGWEKRRPQADDLYHAFPDGHGYNVGVLLGEPSDGLVDIDLDTPAACRVAPYLLPATAARFGRPGKPGSHYLYHCDTKTEQFANREGAMVVEIRSTGGQTIFPPSAHAGTGEPIRWEQEGDPATVDADKLRAAVTRVAAAAILAEAWPSTGARQDAALALGGGLLRAGWSREEVERFIEAVAVAAGDEEARDRLKTVKHSAEKLQAGESVTGFPRLKEHVEPGAVDLAVKWMDLKKALRERAIEDFGFLAGDVKNARRLIETFDGNMRYAAERKVWLVWTGKVWEADAGEAALYSYARSVINGIALEAARADTPEKQEALFKEASALSNLSKQKAMIEQASKQREAQVRVDDLDADPWLFCCENGTIDLRTGELRPHRREDYITKKSGVAYSPNARSELLEAFLERVLPDEGTRWYVQKALGYSLTGSTAEEKLFFAFGPPAGGKSTLIEAVRGVLGPHASTLSFDTLLKRKYARAGEARPDLAKLVGIRFALAVEASGDQQFDEELINHLTGGDMITTRHLYCEEFDFKPRVKLWLAANNIPSVSGPAGAIWRRLRLIPFDLTIPADERDPSVKLRLQTTEQEAVLAWMVQGCLAWQWDGLKEPPAVARLTQKERGDSDPLKEFLEDCCLVEPHATVRNPDLWQAYTTWAKQSRVRPLRRRVFTRLMLERPGVDSYRNNGRVWTGIGLLDDPIF